MIHIFINALAASAGGGLTYVRNVIPHIGTRNDVRATVLVTPRLRRELRSSASVVFMEQEIPLSAMSRFWFEQRKVRELIRDCGANVLLSAGNFALWHSPVPQILLSRNSLYVSPDFYRDLRARGDYLQWLDTQVKGSFAKWSIETADSVVAPSEAFAGELQRWTGKPITAVHHGFDSETFVRDQSPLSAAAQEMLNLHPQALRLLFVSHYNYYRNFETLIRALPLIKQRLGFRRLCLFLTCRLAPGANPGRYRTGSAVALVRELKLNDEVVELGYIPYNLLHHVYRSADIYVSPAYAESFAHPLVESMSTGLPVVASDIAVHHEICGPAALYFERFSPQQLAERVMEVAGSPQLSRQLSQAGLERSAGFSWRDHVDRILRLASELVSGTMGHTNRSGGN